MNKFEVIYEELFNLYGGQGWWPVTPTCTVDIRPMYGISTKTDKQRLEIAIGAILTQNTTWKNAEKAIIRLNEKSLIGRQTLIDIRTEDLAEVIRPAGYFNQKAKKIKLFLEYDSKVKGKYTRKGLLSVWGLGPETVDCILLYARKEAYFVIDAYTLRFFQKLGFLDGSEDYHKVQEMFHKNLQGSFDEARKSRFAMFHKNLEKDVKIFQEYHALLVEHGKRYYSKKPWGKSDPILKKFIEL